VDFTGFQKLVDLLGGVDVYVEKAIYDPQYPDENMKGYSTFSIKAGQQHLDGKTALKYARSRETTSDFDRSRRQQQVLIAIRDKAASSGILSNPKKLLDTISLISQYIRTDLSADELKTLADLSKDIDKSKIKNQILSTDVGGPLISDSSSGTYYIKTKVGNYSELQKIAKNIFEESGTTSKEQAKIEILNGSKTSGLGGKLSEALKSKGYNIVNVQTAKTLTKTTVIYDYSGGTMKETLKYLKEALDADVITKTSTNKSIDISIIIGDDYKEISNNN
jgi:anionic cell wall polymer biosynthesis LytR-Cps2A-Psr (LCP) family protein